MSSTMVKAANDSSLIRVNESFDEAKTASEGNMTHIVQGDKIANLKKFAMEAAQNHDIYNEAAGKADSEKSPIEGKGEGQNEEKGADRGMSSFEGDKIDENPVIATSTV